MLLARSHLLPSPLASPCSKRRREERGGGEKRGETEGEVDGEGEGGEGEGEGEGKGEGEGGEGEGEGGGQGVSGVGSSETTKIVLHSQEYEVLQEASVCMCASVTVFPQNHTRLRHPCSK